MNRTSQIPTSAAMRPVYGTAAARQRQCRQLLHTAATGCVAHALRFTCRPRTVCAAASLRRALLPPPSSPISSPQLSMPMPMPSLRPSEEPLALGTDEQNPITAVLLRAIGIHLNARSALDCLWRMTLLFNNEQNGVTFLPSTPSHRLFAMYSDMAKLGEPQKQPLPNAQCTYSDDVSLTQFQIWPIWQYLMCFPTAFLAGLVFGMQTNPAQAHLVTADVLLVLLRHLFGPTHVFSGQLRPLDLEEDRDLAFRLLRAFEEQLATSSDSSPSKLSGDKRHSRPINHASHPITYRGKLLLYTAWIQMGHLSYDEMLQMARGAREIPYGAMPDLQHVLMSGLIAQHQTPAAERLMHEISAMWGTEPDIGMHMALLRGYANAGELDNAFRIFKIIDSQWWPIPAATWIIVANLFSQDLRDQLKNATRGRYAKPSTMVTFGSASDNGALQNGMFAQDSHPRISADLMHFMRRLDDHAAHNNTDLLPALAAIHARIGNIDQAIAILHDLKKRKGVRLDRLVPVYGVVIFAILNQHRLLSNPHTHQHHSFADNDSQHKLSDALWKARSLLIEATSDGVPLSIFTWTPFVLALMASGQNETVVATVRHLIKISHPTLGILNKDQESTYGNREWTTSPSAVHQPESEHVSIVLDDFFVNRCLDWAMLHDEMELADLLRTAAVNRGIPLHNH